VKSNQPPARKLRDPSIVDESSTNSTDPSQEAGDLSLRLANRILGKFLDTLSPEDLEWLLTPEGAEAFRKAWPKIVETYFNVVVNPDR
jgi:hypothetical protein